MRWVFRYHQQSARMDRYLYVAWPGDATVGVLDNKTKEGGGQDSGRRVPKRVESGWLQTN
jgi:hypothetical protein